MFSYGSVFELLIYNGINGVLNLLPKGKRSYPGSQKNAVADDRVLKFLYDADLRHVESSVRCHRKYKNGRKKVDLG